MRRSNKSLFYRIITVICCVFGVLGVAFGMIWENNAAFILGILGVVTGYLLIRRKLKAGMGKP